MQLRIDVYVHTADDLAQRLDEILVAVKEGQADQDQLVKIRKDLETHSKALKDALEAVKPLGTQ